MTHIIKGFVRCGCGKVHVVTLGDAKCTCGVSVRTLTLNKISVKEAGV